MLMVTGGIELPICDFLLVCNSNHMAISHHLSVCGYLKILSVCYHWGNISDPHPQVAPLLLLGQIKLLITKLNSSVDLDFDRSRSLKVRYDGIIGLPIYVFLVRFSSNIWPNMACLRDTFYRYKALKCQWPWLWRVKVTQGQVWWCHWTPDIWFPIYV